MPGGALSESRWVRQHEDVLVETLDMLRTFRRKFNDISSFELFVRQCLMGYHLNVEASATAL